MKDYAVRLMNVDKIYNLISNDKRTKERFYALRNINIEIKKGEILGILGTNGSGKSTLSSILAGISCIDGGEIEINGEQELISINTGLNNQLTGVENIKAKGALMGLSKKRIQEITEGVVEFSELGDFIYQPVKKYSSGMKARLGFSISMNLDPDIMIIDEALSVGDKSFADKCLSKFEEFKKEGKTIIFISHSLPQMKSFCERGLWIENGEVQMSGNIDEVADCYDGYVNKIKKMKGKELADFKKECFEKRLIKEKKKTGCIERIIRGKQ